MRTKSTNVVWVRPSTNPRRTAQVLRWLRWLVPAALLVVSPTPEILSELGGDGIAVDADEACSGPLSVAETLARGVRR